ncbi:MAG: hypothetical protein HY720_05600 [Planctomycetes bacterium]|nr:hypothetical protein [Planctomycetota bacterium]
MERPGFGVRGSGFGLEKTGFRPRKIVVAVGLLCAAANTAAGLPTWSFDSGTEGWVAPLGGSLVAEDGKLVFRGDLAASNPLAIAVSDFGALAGARRLSARLRSNGLPGLSLGLEERDGSSYVHEAALVAGDWRQLSLSLSEFRLDEEGEGLAGRDENGRLDLEQVHHLVLVLSGAGEVELSIDEIAFEGEKSGPAGERSFRMGFTPFPFEFSLEAVEETYGRIREHGDLDVHHLDEGVPWPEALEGGLSPGAQRDLEFRVAHLSGNRRVFVAVTPIADSRDGLAKYRGDSPNMERPDGWEGKDFDDPDAIRAYTNFCRAIVERFHPDYLAYGIEVNLLAEKNRDAYSRLGTMAREVYRTLKEERPDLPVFLTFGHSGAAGEDFSAIRELLPYSDLVAVSTYPTREDALSDRWLASVRALAPEKPFAIAETGFIAEDLTILGHTQPGNEAGQAEYVSRLLQRADEQRAEFVVWFVPRDYDRLWAQWESLGAPNELAKIWRDTGLWDGEGRPRAGSQVWDSWLSRPPR